MIKCVLRMQEIWDKIKKKFIKIILFPYNCFHPINFQYLNPINIEFHWFNG